MNLGKFGLIFLIKTLYPNTNQFYTKLLHGPQKNEKRKFKLAGLGLSSLHGLKLVSKSW